MKFFREYFLHSAEICARSRDKAADQQPAPEPYGYLLIILSAMLPTMGSLDILP